MRLVSTRIAGTILNGKIEDGTLIDSSLRPNRAAMPDDYFLAGGEPYSSAFVVMRRVQPFKWLEKFGGVFHFETRTIVPHKKDLKPTFTLLGAELNSRRAGLRCKLPRVANQILEQYAKQARVASDDALWTADEINLSFA